MLSSIWFLLMMSGIGSKFISESSAINIILNVVPMTVSANDCISVWMIHSNLVAKVMDMKMMRAVVPDILLIIGG